MQILQCPEGPDDLKEGKGQYKEEVNMAKKKKKKVNCMYILVKQSKTSTRFLQAWKGIIMLQKRRFQN